MGWDKKQGSTSIDPNSHTHSNKPVLDKLSENETGLLFNNNPISGGHTHTNLSTLEKLTDNGTGLLFNGSPISGGSTNVNVSGRSHAIFSLRGGVINIVKTNVANSNTVTMTFPTLDSDRYRRLFVYKPAGGLLTIDIPNNELLENDALVYDISTNTITKKNGTWGNVPVSQNEYLLLYNNLGIIGGELSKYVVYGYDNTNIKVREIVAEQIKNTGSTQGIFIVDGRLYTCAHSSDDHTTDTSTLGSSYFVDPAVTTNISMTHNFGHMNAPTYSKGKDCFLVGNGSKDYTLLPKGWIVPNFKSLLVNGGFLNWHTVEKVELDFTQFTGEYKGQLCWGYDGTDICYLMTNDNRTLRRIQLGKGANNLGSGVFISGTPDTKYNGSYSVLDTWQSRTEDVLGGMFFYKGYIYTGAKGKYGIRKCIPLSNGYFDTEYLQLAGQIGDMQGIAEQDGMMYLFTDSKGYRTDAELFK